MTANNHLPIGFTTSTKMSALVLKKLSRRLAGYLSKFNVEHSILVDDITISGDLNLRRLKSGIKSLVEKEGYRLKQEKTIFRYNREPQVTTGIVVNNDLSAEKDKVEKVKNAIFVCSRFGIDTYLKQYEPGLSKKSLRDKMAGRLGNLISINRPKYQKLQTRWKSILEKEKGSVLIKIAV